MHALAAYIVRGRIQAGGIIGLFGALSILLPPLSYLSNAALSLVVLRQGVKEGLIAMAGASLLCGVVSFVSLKSPILALALILAFWLPVLFGSHVLRATRSQTMLLISAIVVALVFSISMRVFMDDVEAFWQGVLSKVLVHAQGIDAEKQAILNTKLGAVINGFVAAGLGTSVVVSTLLARWWQSKLYNPGGFGDEFRKIQLPQLIIVPVVVGIIATMLLNISIPPYGLVLDAVLVGIMVLMFHGLSVVHFFAKKRSLNVGWLVGLYFFLLVASPYAISILALTGIFDSFFDYRKLRRQTN